MSIIRRLLDRPEARSVDSLAEILGQARGGASWAGPVVTPETAMRLSAWWSAVNLMADLIATLPVDVFRGSGRQRVEVSPPPPLIASPSSLVSPIAWRRQVIISWLMRGNVWGIETQSDRGWPAKIEIAHPDDMSWRQERAPLGPVVWSHQGRVMPAGVVHHEPAFTVPGSPIGLSPVAYMRQAIGLGLAAQEYAARFFGDGAHPSAVLKTDQQIDESTAAIIKQRFVDAIRGKREPAVLGAGLDYKPIQLSPADAAFLDAMRLNRSEIVSIVFPHLILSEGATLTYANVEARMLDLLVFDVQPWIVRLEAWLSSMLPRGQYVKLNTGALIRTTLKERYQAHAIAIRNGWRSVNEVKDLEDEQPIGPDGDRYLWPLVGAKDDGDE